MGGVDHAAFRDMQLYVEIEGETEPPGDPVGGPGLVGFVSFAAMRGFGAQHPMLDLADHLYEKHRVRLGPLTTFYEGHVEDAEDEEKLNMTWQPAAELQESVDQAIEALDSAGECRDLLQRAQAESLPADLRALREHIQKAAAAGKRVRLSYAL
jgi:hypothetical protein